MSKYCRTLNCWQERAKEDYCTYCGNNHFQKIMKMVSQRMPLNWNQMLSKNLVLLVIFGNERDYYTLDFQHNVHFGPVFQTIPLSALPKELHGTALNNTKVRILTGVMDHQTLSLKVAGYYMCTRCQC